MAQYVLHDIEANVDQLLKIAYTMKGPFEPVKSLIFTEVGVEKSLQPKVLCTILEVTNRVPKDGKHCHLFVVISRFFIAWKARAPVTDDYSHFWTHSWEPFIRERPDFASVFCAVYRSFRGIHTPRPLILGETVGTGPMSRCACANCPEDELCAATLSRFNNAGPHILFDLFGPDGRNVWCAFCAKYCGAPWRPCPLPADKHERPHKDFREDEEEKARKNEERDAADQAEWLRKKKERVAADEYDRRRKVRDREAAWKVKHGMLD